MNYIITGGTGFIGTHLTNLIKEQDKNAQVCRTGDRSLSREIINRSSLIHNQKQCHDNDAYNLRSSVRKNVIDINIRRKMEKCLENWIFIRNFR